MFDPTTVQIPPGAPGELDRVETPDGRRYMLDGREVPSVTEVLRATEVESDELVAWRESAGFDELAAAEYERDRGAARGRLLDDLVEGWLWHRRTGACEVWVAAQQLVKRIDRVHASQLTIASREHRYAGTLDHVVTYVGRIALVDTKLKRKRPKRAWLHEYELQVAAYWGAARELGIRFCGGPIEIGLVACCVPGRSPTGRPLQPTILELGTDDLERLFAEFLTRRRQWEVACNRG